MHGAGLLKHHRHGVWCDSALMRKRYWQRKNLEGEVLHAEENGCGYMRRNRRETRDRYDAVDSGKER
jgi:hypothetical protein